MCITWSIDFRGSWFGSSERREALGGGRERLALSEVKANMLTSRVAEVTRLEVDVLLDEFALEQEDESCEDRLFAPAGGRGERTHVHGG